MGCDEPAAVDTVTARRSGMPRLRRSSPRAVQAWSGGLGTSVLSGPRGASARPDFEARAAVILDLYLIADNGSDHRGQAAAGRLRDAHPNAIMIHTPVHASWLNQIEVVFSVIQKKVLTPGDFPGLGTLSHALLAFVNRYNRTARPFNWKFTADDLTALLRRTSQREQAPASQQAHLSRAA
jgi:hypothetical protein